MKIPSILAAASLAGLLLTSFASAQTPSPAAAPAAAAPSATDKKAVAKACSEKATAQGLHGKERKAFRSKCKRGQA